jgi:glycosyltransferase involved in cell wall biosynthesis
LKIVAAVPAFNEETTIAKIIARAMDHVDEVLVVDDGSQDDTSLIAGKMGAVVLKHEKNLGKGAALRDCFAWAKQNGADVLVTMDADGQHDPSLIPKLIEKMGEENADVVIGSRLVRPADMPKYRWLGERALDNLVGVKIGNRVVDAQSGFRAYSRRAIEALVASEFGMGVDSVLIMDADRAGLKIAEIPATVNYAGLATSTHNPVMHSLDVLFSVVKFVSIRHPLLFYGGFSLIAFIVALVFGYQTIDYYQRWGRVITNLALISVASGILAFLALFTGIILFTLITVIREKR